MFILGISGIVWVLVFEFFTFHSVVPGFFLVLDPRGRNGGLVGTVGSTCTCEEFEDSEVVGLVV